MRSLTLRSYFTLPALCARAIQAFRFSSPPAAARMPAQCFLVMRHSGSRAQAVRTVVRVTVVAAISCLVSAAVSSVPLSVSLQRTVLGRSEHGRPIELVVAGDPSAQRRLLVVGCVHGNECAGIAVARALERLRPSNGAAFWVVPDLNPDGAAAGMRGNADGVDLNRNFPFRWRPLTGTFNAGSSPLSEPESRIASRLIRSVRPTVTIWFHQHEDLVDASGGNIAVERRYARLVGLPLRRLSRYPGSATGWQDHVLPHGTAFVVELPPGSLTSTRADQFARAALRLISDR